MFCAYFFPEYFIRILKMMGEEEDQAKEGGGGGKEEENEENETFNKSDDDDDDDPRKNITRSGASLPRKKCRKSNSKRLS